MKTSSLFPAILLAVAVLGTTTLAQDNSTPVPAAQASAAPTVINGFVYVAKLPTPTQLLKDAEAEGLTIGRMDQSADRIVVVYQYPDGRTRTFAYTPAAAQGSAPVVQAAPLATANATYTVVSAPPPPPTTTVVYVDPSPVYYSTRYYRSYDPAWDFWAPLSLGIGLGWVSGGQHSWYGHGGHHSWHGHGGWHR
jgi:hypothetical protein